ncbi:MAG: hypothetical protein EPN88_01530, partial [Bacteroidetes bacterium]
QKTYTIDKVGLISRKNIDQKVAHFIKADNGKISAVITVANDTISSGFITNKSLKKAVKKEEMKVVNYYYNENEKIERFVDTNGKAISKFNNVFSFYNYTRPMMIFTGLGLLALLFAFLLKAEDKKKGYGLEMPNIKNLE